MDYSSGDESFGDDYDDYFFDENGEFGQLEVEYEWDPFSDFDYFHADFESEEEDHSDSDSECAYGTLVKKLRSSDKEGKCKDVETLAGCERDIWTTIPDDVMMSIVARLPFSSVCTFRSVCKKWNSLVVYPDPSLMTMKGSSDVPVCVTYIGSNQFACYNPSSHSWHHLPARFGFSFGLLAFQGEESRVVAGAGGLLVLESRHMGLWIVNPVNKFERRLHPPPIPDGFDRASVRNVHLHLDEDDFYQVFVVFHVTSRVIVEDVFHLTSCVSLEDKDDETKMSFLDLQIYDSRTDTWERSNKWGNSLSCLILSTVEYKGDLCCLTLSDIPGLPEPCDVFVMRLDRLEYNPRVGNQTTKFKFWAPGSLADLPDGLQGGQLFVKERRLMLGGVTTDQSGIHGFSRTMSVHIWKLNSSETAWHEVARMPEELSGKLAFNSVPHVTVRGEYMCVTNSNLSDRNALEGVRDCDGVMCHIPSDRWWKVPRYWDNPKLRLDPSLAEQQALYQELCSYYSDAKGTVAPFLFEPRMDLVP